MTTQKRIAAKVNAQTVEQAMQVYSGLRMAYITSRRDKEIHSASLMQVMTMAGDALEARIGADRFDALMEEIDEYAYA